MNDSTGRINQIILIGTFVGFSWLGMQAVHELGHVLGAVSTGGKATVVSACLFAVLALVESLLSGK
ncbi:MAG: hypothetical protein C0404_14085 [Verrucomicrobia bacterium]|nr:hypothetical protein [Verrucomicrobiota bacterium]